MSWTNIYRLTILMEFITYLLFQYNYIKQYFKLDGEKSLESLVYCILNNPNNTKQGIVLIVFIVLTQITINVIRLHY